MRTEPTPPSVPPRLSAELEALHLCAKGQWLTVRGLRQALHTRGTPPFLVLLALPFCVIGLPGLVGSRVFIGLTCARGAQGLKKLFEVFNLWSRSRGRIHGRMPLTPRPRQA